MTLNLSIDLGQTEILTTSSTQTIAKITRNVGVICDYQNMINPPIYLKSRPNNNSFSVKIMNNEVIATTNYNYILTLHFQKI